MRTCKGVDGPWKVMEGCRRAVEGWGGPWKGEEGHGRFGTGPAYAASRPTPCACVDEVRVANACVDEVRVADACVDEVGADDDV